MNAITRESIVRELIQMKKGEIDALENSEHQILGEMVAEKTKPQDSDSTSKDDLNKIRKFIREKEAVIKVLTDLPNPKKPFTKISEGCLFLMNYDGEKKWYLMVAKNGACTVKIHGIEISSMSTEAPIAKEIMDKTAGIKIVFRGRDVQILKIL